MILKKSAFVVVVVAVSVAVASLAGADEITWLSRNTEGVPATGLDSGANVIYPASYVLHPSNPPLGGRQLSILAYTDDWVHTTPNTFVELALSRLGYTATIYVGGDYTGFETALTTGGPWDIVIWSGENTSVPTTTTAALLAYVQGGGALAATYWRQLVIPTDPLWAAMGFTYISNYVTPPPAYWWDPSNPIFTTPESAPEWLTRVQNSGTSQGTRIEPLAAAAAIAGYTTTATTNEAGLVVRNDGLTVYKALRDVSTNADADGDTVLDGVELWENIIASLATAVPVELMEFRVE